jgi:IQ calmodulin-binding motif
MLCVYQYFIAVVADVQCMLLLFIAAGDWYTRAYMDSNRVTLGPSRLSANTIDKHTATATSDTAAVATDDEPIGLTGYLQYTAPFHDDTVQKHPRLAVEIPLAMPLDTNDVDSSRTTTAATPTAADVEPIIIDIHSDDQQMSIVRPTDYALAHDTTNSFVSSSIEVIQTHELQPIASISYSELAAEVLKDAHKTGSQMSVLHGAGTSATAIKPKQLHRYDRLQRDAARLRTDIAAMLSSVQQASESNTGSTTTPVVPAVAVKDVVAHARQKKIELQSLDFELAQMHRVTARSETADLELAREQLTDSTVLQQDELMSRKLECNSAVTVQKRARGITARVYTDNFRTRRHTAAATIQAGIRGFLDRRAYKLYRKRYVSATAITACVRKFLQRRQFLRNAHAAKQERAVLLLQRCSRGMIGRQRAAQRLKMTIAMRDARELVSANQLLPKHLLCLSVALLLPMVDHTAHYPHTTVLVLLRLLLQVLYSNDGSSAAVTYETAFGTRVSVNASLNTDSASWDMCMRVLRRPVTLLRRLRAVGESTSELLHVSDSAVASQQLLRDVVQMYTTDNSATSRTTVASVHAVHSDAAHAICTLAQWVLNIVTAYTQQKQLEQFLLDAQPSWSRRLRALQKRRRQLQLAYTVAVAALNTVQLQQDALKLAGLAFGSTADAQDVLQVLVVSTTDKLQQCDVKLNCFVNSQLQRVAAATEQLQLDVTHAREEVMMAERALDVFQRINGSTSSSTDNASTTEVIDNSQLVTALHDSKAQLNEHERRLHVWQTVTAVEQTAQLQLEVQPLADHTAQADAVGILQAKLQVLTAKRSVFIQTVGGLQYITSLNTTDSAAYNSIVKHMKILNSDIECRLQQLNVDTIRWECELDTLYRQQAAERASGIVNSVDERAVRDACIEDSTACDSEVILLMGQTLPSRIATSATKSDNMQPLLLLLSTHLAPAYRQQLRDWCDSGYLIPHAQFHHITAAVVNTDAVSDRLSTEYSADTLCTDIHSAVTAALVTGKHVTVEVDPGVSISSRKHFLVRLDVLLSSIDAQIAAPRVVLLHADDHNAPEFCDDTAGSNVVHSSIATRDGYVRHHMTAAAQCLYELAIVHCCNPLAATTVQIASDMQIITDTCIADISDVNSSIDVIDSTTIDDTTAVSNSDDATICNADNTTALNDDTLQYAGESSDSSDYHHNIINNQVEDTTEQFEQDDIETQQPAASDASEQFQLQQLQQLHIETACMTADNITATAHTALDTTATDNTELVDTKENETAIEDSNDNCAASDSTNAVMSQQNVCRAVPECMNKVVTAISILLQLGKVDIGHTDNSSNTIYERVSDEIVSMSTTDLLQKLYAVDCSTVTPSTALALHNTLSPLLHTADTTATATAEDSIIIEQWDCSELMPNFDDELVTPAMLTLAQWTLHTYAVAILLAYSSGGVSQLHSLLQDGTIQEQQRDKQPSNGNLCDTDVDELHDDVLLSSIAVRDSAKLPSTVQLTKTTIKSTFTASICDWHTILNSNSTSMQQQQYSGNVLQQQSINCSTAALWPLLTGLVLSGCELLTPALRMSIPSATTAVTVAELDNSSTATATVQYEVTVYKLNSCLLCRAVPYNSGTTITDQSAALVCTIDNADVQALLSLNWQERYDATSDTSSSKSNSVGVSDTIEVTVTSSDSLTSVVKGVLRCLMIDTTATTVSDNTDGNSSYTVLVCRHPLCATLHTQRYLDNIGTYSIAIYEENRGDFSCYATPITDATSTTTDSILRLRVGKSDVYNMLPEHSALKNVTILSGTDLAYVTERIAQHLQVVAVEVTGTGYQQLQLILHPLQQATDTADSTHSATTNGNDNAYSERPILRTVVTSQQTVEASLHSNTAEMLRTSSSVLHDDTAADDTVQLQQADTTATANTEANTTAADESSIQLLTQQLQHDSDTAVAHASDATADATYGTTATLYTDDTVTPSTHEDIISDSANSSSHTVRGGSVTSMATVTHDADVIVDNDFTSNQSTRSGCSARSMRAITETISSNTLGLLQYAVHVYEGYSSSMYAGLCRYFRVVIQLMNESNSGSSASYTWYTIAAAVAYTEELTHVLHSLQNVAPLLEQGDTAAASSSNKAIVYTLYSSLEEMQASM